MDYEGQERRKRTLTVTEQELAELLEKAAERGGDRAIQTLYANVGGTVVKKLVWAVAIAVTIITGAIINYFAGGVKP